MLRSGRNILHNQWFSIWPFGGGEFNTTNTHTAARWRMFKTGTADVRINKGLNNSDAPRWLRNQPNMIVRCVQNGNPGESLVRQRVKRGSVFGGDRLVARIMAMGPRGRSFDFGLEDQTKSVVMEAAANSRTITGITNAAIGVVTVSGSSKPYSDDNLVYIEGLSGAMTNPNHQFFIVKNASTSAPWTFQLYRYVNGVATPYDTSSLGAYGSGGIVYKPKPVVAELDMMLPPQANTDLFFYSFINPSISGSFIIMAVGLWSVGVNEDVTEWEYRTEGEEWRLMEQFLLPIYRGEDFTSIGGTTTAQLATVQQAPPGGWHKTPTPVWVGPSSGLDIMNVLSGAMISGTGTPALGGTVAAGSGAGIRTAIINMTWASALTQAVRYMITGTDPNPIIVFDADE